MRKTVTFIGISTLFIVLLFSAFFTLLRFEKQYPLYSLEKGWVATYRNQQYLNTELGALSDQIGVSFSRGDKITLTLPKLLKSAKLRSLILFSRPNAVPMRSSSTASLSPMKDSTR